MAKVAVRLTGLLFPEPPDDPALHWEGHRTVRRPPQQKAVGSLTQWTHHGAGRSGGVMDGAPDCPVTPEPVFIFRLLLAPDDPLVFNSMRRTIRRPSSSSFTWRRTIRRFLNASAGALMFLSVGNRDKLHCSNISAGRSAGWLKGAPERSLIAAAS